MPTAIDRADFLRRLKMAAPGLSHEDSIQQSSCFAFRNGMILTYNEQVACRVKSPLDKAITGAVKAMPLLKMLERWTEETINIAEEQDKLIIIGKRRRTKLIKEAEVVLGIDAVEKPNQPWKALPTEFGEAIKLVQNCAATKNEHAFCLTCVHIAPGWVEACDNLHLARYTLKTGLEQGVLVKPEAIRHITSLAMGHFTETNAWIHFRNDQMYMSCRRFVEPYPDLKRGLDVTGEPCTLPRSLAEDCENANICSEEYGDTNRILVQLKPGDIYINGIGTHIEYDGAKKLKYNGPPVRFYINPKMMVDIVKGHLDCEISANSLKVTSGKLTYVAFLFPDRKKADEPAAKED